MLDFEPETTGIETETYIETESVSETIGLLDNETTESESSDNEEETMEIDTKEAEPTIGLLP